MRDALRLTFSILVPSTERLDRFLSDLPGDGLSYAVEVRNRAWLTPAFRDLLARR